MRKILKILFGRTILIGISIFIQSYFLIMAIWRFSSYFILFYSFSTLLSILAVFWIINRKGNPAYKIAWIIPIMIFPIFGGLFYLMFGGNKTGKRSRKQMQQMRIAMESTLGQNSEVFGKLEEESLSAASQSRYIEKFSYCPVYANTETLYLSPGEVKFGYLVEELRKAEKYIFLEYFIIDEGTMWNTVLGILKEKVQQGLDVRLIYDDMGCLLTLPYRYDRVLEGMGIKCCVFNPFVPLLSVRMNHRDHRKIVVIDGQTAFTGGINLADEYINKYRKYGHWKDSSIMLKGEAVWSLTVMFLTMWSFIRSTSEDYSRFRPMGAQRTGYSFDGYVQPFADSPLDDEAVGETVYLNIINKANRYVYINTPYLVLDDEMATALCMAAKRGIDVRIITPHIPDKWYVHAVSRSNYEMLVESGVRIYEYTPGFVHSKTFVSDDEYAVVGTINLDYRSLFLHFECGVWLYRTKSVWELKEDYLQTLNKCKPVTLADCRSVKWYRRIGRSVLRAFAPLM